MCLRSADGGQWRPRAPEDAISQAQRQCRGTFTCVINRSDLISATKFPEIRPLLAQVDVLLCDEDVRTLSGERRDPAFNGRWDPDASLGRPPSSLILFRTNLIEDCGGWRGPSEDGYACRLLQWDLLLRIGHHRRDVRIEHAPVVMVHRREVPAHALKPSPSVMEAIIKRFLNETGQGSTVQATGSSSGTLRLRYQRASTPKASIIVPTRDRIELLKPCIESLLSQTRYPHFEVLVVDNESSEPETHAFLTHAASDPRVRPIRCKGVFNWALSNNVGATDTDGEVLIFLNNDTVVINDDWLDELISQALRPEIGIVGAKLYYPDNRVQHAGIVVDRDGNALHGWRYALREDPGYLDQLSIVRSVSAVTGACMAIRRDVFRKLGGFDETLRVAWNDVDLCLRSWAAGYRVIWTPHAELYHHEGGTRSFDSSPQDEARAVRETDQVRNTHRALLPALNFQSPNLLCDRDQPYLSTRVLADLAERHPFESSLTRAAS
ncbi:hypothetical protein DK389_28600 [Methylobacterium durans]|uniref:Glycosyltransferase 2-like domain-containing protein n=1 Tax=Methylobacterium durans TaxID=2202825 RepID=A0A2U8WCE5_9HYPH|nr:hypothetical protein DK389_28600 [Methylobacterium durans]